MKTKHRLAAAMILGAALGGSATMAHAQMQTYMEAVQAAAAATVEQRYDDARSDLRAALLMARGDEQRATVQKMLASLDTRDKKYTEARERLRGVLALADIGPSTRMSALEGIGQAFDREGKRADARAAYDQAMGVEGVSALEVFPVALQRAQSFAFDKQYAEARAAYSKALTYRDEVPFAELMVTFLVGQAFLDERLLAEAKAKFTEVLTWKPADPKPGANDPFAGALDGVVRQYRQLAQVGLADISLREKNFAKAKSEYNAILALPDLDQIAKAATEQKLQALAEKEKAG